MTGPGRGVFAVDASRTLAELELAWAAGGYHGFSADRGTWCAISSAGEVLTGATPDELDRGDPRALAGDAMTASCGTSLPFLRRSQE